MPFTLLQVGGTLKSVNSQGGLSNALTLPAGVSLATNRVPRFAKFKNYTIVVNTPSRPVSVDTSGVVRLLTPTAPASAVVLSAGSAGNLSGDYAALQTYVLLDALGNIIAESDFGPAMATAVNLSSQTLSASFADCPDVVDAIKLYRTTSNGNVYFPWLQIAGNSTTSVSNDNTADTASGTVAAPALGSAPDLTLIAEFNGRLWGVDRNDVDDLRYTEAGTMYGWSLLNTLPIPHVGSDAAGIVALVPRRNALGVARRDNFQQVTGSVTSNIAPNGVNGGENVGCVSQESVAVFNDVAYFLWRDGVYKWDATGISCITNAKVRSWFTSDQYFNRAMFWRAQGEIDPKTLKYRLFLASPGSAVLDRWIEYDILTGAWWGPHSTAAFTSLVPILIAGADQQPWFMIGGAEGYLSQEQEARTDWGVSPIRLHLQTVGDTMGDPENEKYFGELSVHLGPQSSGTATLTPSVGEADNPTATAPISVDLTQSRDRLGRVGVGKQMTLDLVQTDNNQDCEWRGYTVDPVNVVGRR